MFIIKKYYLNGDKHQVKKYDPNFCKVGLGMENEVFLLNGKTK